MIDSEVKEVVERYARRSTKSDRRYSIFEPSVWQSVQERQRSLIRILAEHLKLPVDEAAVLEIGCGWGMNLIELIRLGFRPGNLVGNELLHERIRAAREVLPTAVRLFEGDATELVFPESSFDIVYQSTVFTSLLEDAFQNRLAAAMWRWVKPGGGVLWYDFIYDNPANPDVRGVKIARVRSLFPAGEVHATRITLAPPISRRVTRIHPAAYNILNLLPFLRTHVLCWIGKCA